MSQTLPRRSNPGDVVDMRDIPRLAKAILGCEAGGVRNAASSVGTLRCCAVSPMWFSSAPRPTPKAIDREFLQRYTTGFDAYRSLAST